MAEVTRVPLQPIAKGSLTKLWLGVLAALLVAGLVAWSTMPSSLTVTELTAGSGATPAETDWVLVNYKGTLDNGTVFDEGQQAAMQLSGVVPGFREGLMQMQKGGKYDLHIPADKGYGAQVPPGGPIPPNANLNFEVELLDFISDADYQQMVQQQQQMMQQMQQQGGAGGVPPMPQNGQ